MLLGRQLLLLHQHHGGRADGLATKGGRGRPTGGEGGLAAAGRGGVERVDHAVAELEDDGRAVVAVELGELHELKAGAQRAL